MSSPDPKCRLQLEQTAPSPLGGQASLAAQPLHPGWGSPGSQWLLCTFTAPPDNSQHLPSYFASNGASGLFSVGI